MAKSQIICANCGRPFFKEKREINRARKKGANHFCTQSCGGQHRASQTRARDIVRTCPCGKRFRTSTKKKAAKHCSRSCASRYSMNAQRREAQRRAGLATENLISPAEVLKLRERWKYAALGEVLTDRDHEFEYELGGYVFDLALLDTRVLVEFDGPYHEHGDQPRIDAAKERVAEEAGFIVVRREVQQMSVISPTTLREL